MTQRFLLAIAAVLIASGAANAQQWGHLRGRFVFGGDPPKPSPLAITKDQAFCGAFNLVDESLVVDPESRGLANVIVYLYLGRGDAPPAVHPSYEATAAAEVRLDNASCRFEPHVTLLRTTQTLVIGNSDTVGHNAKIDTFANSPLNPIIPAGGAHRHQFSAPERLPTGVSCSIHGWMNGWLVVRDNPYFAVSGKDGGFEIKNLPAGDWTFQFWHERSGYVKEVTLGGKPTEWSRGRVEFTIKPDGTTDLGDVVISPSLLQ